MSLLCKGTMHIYLDPGIFFLYIKGLMLLFQGKSILVFNCF